MPSTFSAYRWDALTANYDKQGNKLKNIIDEEYLTSVLDPEFDLKDTYTIQKANMFLAEDRLLCLEIFTKKNYVMKYVPGIFFYY